MAKIKRYGYSVYFDSSSVYGEPVARQIIDLIEKYKSDDRVAINIFLPEVVEKEFERRVVAELKNKHKQAQKNLRYINKFFPEVTASLPEEILDNDAIAAKDRVLSDLRIEIVATPTDKIDWKDVIHRATHYEIPFEESHEKGFKDILIAETAIHHFLDSSRKTTFAFVGADSKMNQYLVEKTDKYKKFSVFESVPALDTDIQLRLDENTAKIADVLKAAAAKAFYAAGDNKAIYNSAKIGQQLPRLVDEIITSKEFKERYPSVKIVGVGQISDIEVTNPIFVERPSKATFHWRSNISYKIALDVQRVDETKNRTASLRVDISANWHSDFTKKGALSPGKTKLDSLEISSYDLRVNMFIADLGTGLQGVQNAWASVGQPNPVSTLEAFASAQKSAQDALSNFAWTTQTPSLSDSLRKLLGKSDDDNSSSKQ